MIDNVSIDMDRKNLALRIATRHVTSRDNTGDIGRKIRDYLEGLHNKIAGLRDDIADTQELFKLVDAAWRDWDVDRLEDFYVITKSDAQALREAMNRDQ